MGDDNIVMEFLLTYGWAILVILAAIGALAYYGVLTPENFLPKNESNNSCSVNISGCAPNTSVDSLVTNFSEIRTVIDENNASYFDENVNDTVFLRNTHSTILGADYSDGKNDVCVCYYDYSKSYKNEWSVFALSLCNDKYIALANLSDDRWVRCQW